jgi:DNA repair protein RadC
LSDVGATFRQTLRFDTAQAPLLSHSQALVDYLRLRMAHATSEQFRVLFLNTGHWLIRDEIMSHGSITETTVYPREIIKRALELGAAAIILVHNHPSGDSEPSQADIRMTRKISEAARCMDMSVCDHIIVAKGGWSSFRALGLL